MYDIVIFIVFLKLRKKEKDQLKERRNIKKITEKCCFIDTYISPWEIIAFSNYR